MSTAVEHIGESRYGRSLYFSAIADLDEWPSTLAEPEPYFVLLLALDVHKFTDKQLRAFADKVAAQGVGYVYVWGPDADRVHVIFDEALYVDHERLRREADENDPTILTSSDEDEDLDDAVYFGVFNAYPDDYYAAAEGWNPLLAVVVGSPDWATHVRRRLLDTYTLSEDVLTREPPPRKLDGVRSWWLDRRVQEDAQTSSSALGSRSVSAGRKRPRTLRTFPRSDELLHARLVDRGVSCAVSRCVYVRAGLTSGAFRLFPYAGNAQTTSLLSSQRRSPAK